MGIFGSKPSYEIEIMTLSKDKNNMKKKIKKLQDRYIGLEKRLVLISTVYYVVMVIGCISSLYYNIRIFEVIQLPTQLILRMVRVDIKGVYGWIFGYFCAFVLFYTIQKTLRYVGEHHVSIYVRQLEIIREKQSKLVEEFKKVVDTYKSNIGGDAPNTRLLGSEEIYKEPTKRRVGKKTIEEPILEKPVVKEDSLKLWNVDAKYMSIGPKMVKLVCKECKENNGMCTIDEYMKKKYELKCVRCGNDSITYIGLSI